MGDRVLEAMDRVPREEFVPEDVRPDAYYDTPLPIGHNQTISAPSMVAIMCQALDIREGNKVLEIGTGLGYHAAVMAVLAGASGVVYTVERIPELADMARSVLSRLGFDNVKVFLRDGTEGLPDFAPYDRISVAAAAPDVPQPLVDQLKDPGRLVIPVGRYFQQLMLVEKKGGQIITTDKGGVAFVPLLGKYGFKGY
nr:protein-L-isoaspartate O-methyltransferase [Methanocella arvoryzae]